MKKINKILLGASAAVATVIPTTIALTSCENKGLPTVAYHDGHSRIITLDTVDRTERAVEHFWFVGSLESIKVELSTEIDPDYTGDVWFDMLEPVRKSKDVYFYFKTKADWTGDFPTAKVILHIKTTNKNNQKTYDSVQKFTVKQKTN